MIVYKNNANERVPIAPSARQVTVQVVRREVLMPGVVRLSLALPGTIQAPAPYRPGQFITLALPMQRQTLHRSYSLCGSGQPGQPWVITIKRQPLGVVSTYLYEQVREGMILQASLPHGTFVLPARLRPETPLIFVAAGSGITPMIGMLGALALLPAERRPKAQLHYTARTPAEMIYLKELNALDPHSTWLERRYYFSAQGRRLTPQLVLGGAGHLARQAHWYVCGPEGLKHAMQMALRAAAIPPQQVHVETFASPRPPAATTAISQFPNRISHFTSARLRVADTGTVLHIQPQETLLEALERHGYSPDYSCRAGACGTCKLKLLSGQVQPTGEALSATERKAGYVLGCVARPAGDVVIASAGQPPMSNLAVGARRAPARRQAAIRRVRTMTAVAVLGLLVGSWSLINYKPDTAQTAANSSSSNQSSEDDQQNTSASNSSSSNSSSSSSSSTTSQPPATTTQSGAS